MTTHGHTKDGKFSKTYHAWMNMIGRCKHKNRHNYHLYGGKGIKVCDRWHTFANFLSDMGEAPPDKTLDRIDGNKDYCPENCRWATIFEQASNTKKNVFYTHNGKTKHLSAWAREYGLHRGLLSYRMTHGWTIEEALSIKPSNTNRGIINRVRNKHS